MKDRNTPAIQRIHHPRHASYLLLLTLLFAAAMLLWFEPWRGDGVAPVFYHAQIAPLLIDRSLDASSSYLMSSNQLGTVSAALTHMSHEGYVSGRYPIGPTLLFAPFWVVAHLGDLWIRHPVRCQPFASIYLFAASISALFYGFCGLLLMWRTTTRFVSPRLGFFCTAVIFFGTCGIPVCFKQIGYSPVYAFFASSLFTYAGCESVRYWSWRSAGYLGLASGLLVITCWPAIIFLLLPVVGLTQVFTLRQRSTVNAKSDTTDASAEHPPLAISLQTLLCQMGLGLVMFALTVSPQILFWRKIFGAWVIFPTWADLLPGAFFPAWKQAWMQAMFEPWRNGFFYQYPVVVVGFCALFFTMFRRGLLSVFLFLLPLLFTGVACLPWTWQELEGAVTSGRFFLVAPFLAIGLACFLHEVHSRKIRYMFCFVLTLLVLWNIIHLMSQRFTLGLGSPWTGSGNLRDGGLNILLHPIVFFGDSIIIRYLTQGTPPLESLLFLLLTVLLIPSLTWAVVRHLLPPIRQWSLMKVFALTMFVLLLFFDTMVFQAEMPPGILAAHLDLRDALRDGKQTSNVNPTSNTLSASLRTLHEQNPSVPAITFQLAFHEFKTGNLAQAQPLFEELAGRSYRAGWLGLLQSTSNPEQQVRALAALTRSELCSNWLCMLCVDTYHKLGKDDRARDYLDRAFPSAAAYWSYRTRLTDDPEERAKFEKRAQLYTRLKSLPAPQRSEK
ncbi:TPA: hypothetical protein DDW35_10125 [Candidatus Sumerlaeota bacterium]|jgi:hypothetical protein|nr:hypothetical protein [Candidatus Sumerlaeota bacterium]